MVFPIIVLLSSASHTSLPRPELSRESDAESSSRALDRVPDLAMLVNRSLGALKDQELVSLRALEREMLSHPTKWPRHQLLRVQVALRSLELERKELSVRCAETAAVSDGQDAQADWTPLLTLDPETLAESAAAGLGLRAEDAAELHAGVHLILERIRQQDEGIRYLEQRVLPLSEEAQATALAALGVAASPLDVLDAIEDLAERRQGLIARRVERELSLQSLATLVGIDLHQPAASRSCSATAAL